MLVNHLRSRSICCCVVILILFSDTVNVNSCRSFCEADSKQTYCHDNTFKSVHASPSSHSTSTDDNCDINQNVHELDKMTSLAVIPYDATNIPLHELSVRHFSIAGHTFTIQQDYTGLGVAAVVWDSAVVLANYLQKHKHLVEGKKVLELGAGTGLTGLVAAALGADVTVTERAEVMAYLMSSINLNTQGKSWKISAQVLDWTKEYSSQDFPNFDVILGSDIIYIEETFEDLLRTIKTLAPNNRVCILLSCRIRYDRDLKFLDMLKEDFSVEEIFLDTEKNIQIFSVQRHS